MVVRFIVCGGRDYQDREVVFRSLDKLHVQKIVTLIIHGACCEKGKPTNLTGADRWAQEWAQEREVPYLGVPAEWRLLGNPAGPERNTSMLEFFDQDVHGVVAFTRANAKIGTGTQNMIDQATRAGIKVWQPVREA
jgi:hypothetical protein